MISLTIANIIGWIVGNWRLMLIFVAAIGALILFGLVMHSCEKKPVLNEQQIQKNQDAIASKERQKMEEALIESRIVEKQIDANRSDAENQKLNAIFKAREEAKTMSNEDLAKTLENLK